MRIWSLEFRVWDFERYHVCTVCEENKQMTRMSSSRILGPTQHTHTYTHTHSHTHTHTQTHKNTHKHTKTHTNTHKHTPTHTHKLHACAHTTGFQQAGDTSGQSYARTNAQKPLNIPRFLHPSLLHPSLPLPPSLTQSLTPCLSLSLSLSLSIYVSSPSIPCRSPSDGCVPFCSAPPPEWADAQRRGSRSTAATML